MGVPFHRHPTCRSLIGRGVRHRTCHTTQRLATAIASRTSIRRNRAVRVALLHHGGPGHVRAAISARDQMVKASSSNATATARAPAPQRPGRSARVQPSVPTHVWRSSNSRCGVAKDDSGIMERSTSSAMRLSGHLHWAWSWGSSSDGPFLALQLTRSMLYREAASQLGRASGSPAPGGPNLPTPAMTAYRSRVQITSGWCHPTQPTEESSNPVDRWSRMITRRPR
jgi:hypothetical protein